MASDRDIKGVLQICHGMVEYIDRYDEFAEFMSEHGYYVVGHDHLGHGKSIQTEADLGYFDERKGNQYVIGDIYQLREDDTENIRMCRILCWGTVWGHSC